MRSSVPIPSAVALGTRLSPSPRTSKPRDRLAQAEGSWSNAGTGGPPGDAPGGAGGGGWAPAASLGAFARAVPASGWGVTQGWAGVPLHCPRLTPALEKSQMFFGKQLEQAEAVGSPTLTQTQCLAPGLILHGDMLGSPWGWQPPARDLAKGFPAPRGSAELLAGWAPYQPWQQCGSICPGQRWHLAGNLCVCVICISYTWHLHVTQSPPQFHHIRDPGTSLHARMSHVPWARPLS